MKNPTKYRKGKASELTTEQRQNLTSYEFRVLQIAEWLERDKREPDKVLMYAQELYSATWRANALRRN